MADDTDDGQTRQSSPRFPFISLAKALQRVTTLWEEAGTNLIPVDLARKLWGYAPKSSGGDQTLAALGYYGLLEESGSGDVRRVKLSDMAVRYMREERPEIRRELTAKMVQLPKAMQTLWRLWQAKPPSGAVARSVLKNDLNYSDTAAVQLNDVYRSNLVYFPASHSDVPPEQNEDNEMDDARDEEKPLVDTKKAKKLGSETRQTVFTVPAGDVTITFPADMDASGFRDLKPYLNLFIDQQTRLAIELFSGGVRVKRIYVEGTEDEAILQAQRLKAPTNVDFVRVIDPVGDNGVELWSERRDS